MGGLTRCASIPPVVELNNHMGSTDRVQGGFFANIMDDDSAGTSFKMPPGLTAVSILDYSLTNHVRCPLKRSVARPGIVTRSQCRVAGKLRGGHPNARGGGHRADRDVRLLHQQLRHALLRPST